MDGSRLKLLRKKSEYTLKDLAEKCGVTVNTAWRWENEKQKPSMDVISKLAQILNTSVGYLIGEDSDPENMSITDSFALPPDQIPVKIYSMGICAGPGIDNGRYEPMALRTIPMSRHDVGPGDRSRIYGLEVTGRSMEPKIYDGDTIIVNENEPPGRMDICYARYILNGFWHDAVKYYMPMPDGSIELHASEISGIPPIRFSKDEIAEGVLEILGAVKCRVTVERL